MGRFYWTPPGGVEVPLAEPTFVPQTGREGFDRIEADLYNVRAPYQHGATPLGGTYVPRELYLPLMLMANSADEMAALRRATTRLFAPMAGVGVLRWTHDDGVNWIIRATPTETPTFGRLDKLSGYRVPVEISLRADDPFWYDPDMASIAVGMFEGGWSLPLAFPFELGYATGVATAQNTGDVATPCTITITGPVVYPVIHNQTTGDVWGSSIALLPGEQLIVTSAFNDKTITKLNPVTGHRQNAFGTLRTQSRWIELVPGPNRIGFTHSGEASRAQVQISWYNRFLGA